MMRRPGILYSCAPSYTLSAACLRKHLIFRDSHPVDHLGLLDDGILGEEGGTNLLGDTSSLSLLDGCLTNLEEDQYQARENQLKLTVSSNLVFPVSTCPRIQQMGDLRSSLLPDDAAASLLARIFSIAFAFLSSASLSSLVMPSSSEESSSELESSSSESSSESDSSSDDSSSEDDSTLAGALPLVALTGGLAGAFAGGAAFPLGLAGAALAAGALAAGVGLGAGAEWS